jgi:general secretion pathway protein I
MFPLMKRALPEQRIKKSAMGRCRGMWTDSHSLKRQSGFTLLEIMVAVAIIAIAFVSLLGSQAQSISMASISRFETMASLLAGQKNAELQMKSFAELHSEEGDFEGDFVDFHWQTEVRELTEDEIGIIGTTGMLKLVDLTIRQGSGDSFYRVRSLVMKDIAPVEEN